MRTVKEVIARYRKERGPELGTRTVADYERSLVTLESSFGNKSIDDISRADLAKFMNVTKGKIQRNKNLSVFSAVFSKAMEWGWAEANPCYRFERNEIPRRARQELTEADFQLARKTIEGSGRTEGAGVRTALIMEFVHETGLAQGQILKLKWAQVHAEAGQILFRNPMSKRQIIVPINRALTELLARCQKVCGKKKEYVIPNKFGNRYTSAGFRAMWRRAMIKWSATGKDTFTFHDIARLGRKSREPTRPDVEKTIQGYPQFDEDVRRDASRMSAHYEVFYCLEQSIRKLITDTMVKALGDNWWDTDKVPAQIRQEVAALQAKEVDRGVTRRSDMDIDYTTFGQLSQIITQNWEYFGKTFTAPKAVNNVMTSLNFLRGPIAHCCPISEHEAERLGFAVKDWFNLRLT